MRAASQTGLPTRTGSPAPPYRRLYESTGAGLCDQSTRAFFENAGSVETTTLSTDFLHSLITSFADSISDLSEPLNSLLREPFDKQDELPEGELREGELVDRCARMARGLREVCGRVGRAHRSSRVTPDGGHGPPYRDSESACRVDEIWQHSLAVACAAKLLSEERGDIDPVQAFACGLMHDIGKVVLASQFPKGSARVRQAIRGGEGFSFEVERRICGVDHASVGCHLLAHWSLPKALQDVALSHHLAAEDFPEGFASFAMTELVASGDTWAHQLSKCQAATHRSAECVVGPQEGMDPIALRREIQDIQNRMACDPQAKTPSADAQEQRLNRDSVERRFELSKANPSGMDVILRRIAELQGQVFDIDGLCGQSARILADFFGLSRFVVFAQCEPRSYRTCVFEESQLRYQTVIVRDQVLSANHKEGSDPVESVLSPDAGCTRHDAGCTRHDAGCTRHTELADRFVRFLGPGSVGCISFIHGQHAPGGLLFAIEDNGERLERIDSRLSRTMLLTLGTVFESTLLRRKLQRRAETSLQNEHHQKDALERAVRSASLERVARMAAGAAHEFNNPLAIIAGRAQMLQADIENEAINSDLKLIIAQARRAGDMVSQLMDYARPAKPEPVSIRLLDWAKRLRQHWYRQSDLKPQQIQIGIDSHELTVFADERQLWDSACAIMANAVEAMQSEDGELDEFAHIQINSPATPTDDTIVVAIGDCGRGMPPDVCEHALDPFFSHRAAGRGQGLGLSRAARTIEINGGRLWIDSTEGEGTVVYFGLPSKSD